MNIVCIGAHPDDPEFFAGGTGLKWRDLGHRVVFVSLTNGDIGHHEMAGGALARRRRAEARRSAALSGIEDVVLDHHDGELEPGLELRREVVRIIRRYEADVVLTHRPNDYHPDHRYTSVTVQDAAFMVTVPFFCPDVPALRKNPVFFYLIDRFTKPLPFQPTVAVDITAEMPRKLDLLDAMESQFYEWLPWLDGVLDAVPADARERRQWLAGAWEPIWRGFTALSQPALRAWYGPAADSIEYAEGFELCEYGSQPSRQELRALFPFLPEHA
ncbi:MAG: family deacetylase [Candidatus Hydrogenedentes bacterium]|nr:family deacetylase [Candidatus Hydrogenedentota bacterium]